MNLPRLRLDQGAYFGYLHPNSGPEEEQPGAERPGL